MIYIILFVITLLFLLSVFFRSYIFATPYSEKYTIIDIINFFKHKSWRNYNTGKLICYSGLFGQGKTLNMVHDCVAAYRKYNGKKIYDPFTKKYLIQNIIVLSNVNISIPHIHLSSMAQVVDITKLKNEEGFINKYIVLVDEMSTNMNSRNFKNNIDAQVLNTILTCRHFNISIFYTSQRFQHVDALLRQVTQHVIECEKHWRIFVRKTYDAFELENTSSLLVVKPLHITGVFMTDKDFNDYDTHAVVDQIIRSSNDGDRLSELEIIQLLSVENSVNDGGSKKRKTRSK